MTDMGPTAIAFPLEGECRTSESQQNLPALIDTASRRLMEARSSGEILEARKFANLALHYARITKAANETHADCLRIILRAEMRMADAIDEGQENGEVRTQESGRPESVQTSDTSPATFEELGIARQRVSEWRELRDAGEPAVEAAIQAQLAEGVAPTKSGVQAMLAGFTGNNEWCTPPEWIERARAVMGSIDLDPASSASAQPVVRATEWADIETDGLEHEWNGNIWLNPPYSRGLIEKYVAKLTEEQRAGRLRQAVVLVHSRTDTAWFHKLFSIADAFAITRGRIAFQNKNSPRSSPVNGSVFFYIGNEVARFISEFENGCSVGAPVKAPVREHGRVGRNAIACGEDRATTE
jgi:phage N-6-adenine-methyltransferase